MVTLAFAVLFGLLVLAFGIIRHQSSGPASKKSDAGAGTIAAESVSQEENENTAAEKSAATEENEGGSAGEAATGAAAESAQSGNASSQNTPTANEPAGAESQSTVYVTTGDVNIRSGAGTDSEILSKARMNKAYPKTGEDGEWTIIDFDGQTAYIKTEFLTDTKPETPVWDLSELDNERVDFGYSRKEVDENNVPTGVGYYESRWGEFNVDWIQDTSSKTIYLTMDEGFGNDNTIQILDTLKEKGVNVTFFLTKNFVDDRPELVQRMLDEGHQLGNHTCTHPVMINKTVNEQMDQIMTLHDLIKEKYGYEMKLFRYPEGVFSRQSLGLVNNLGYKVVFWSFAYGDYDEDNQPPVDESLELILNCLHPGAIYLLHASSDTNTALLADFIDGARARGFEFGKYPLD